MAVVGKADVAAVVVVTVGLKIVVVVVALVGKVYSDA